MNFSNSFFVLSIEGIPLIIRFKTLWIFKDSSPVLSIEGIPLIIRFKTQGRMEVVGVTEVLKAFHL